MTIDFASQYNDAQPRPTTGKPVQSATSVSFGNQVEITITGGNNPYTCTVSSAPAEAEEINGIANVPVGSKHQATKDLVSGRYRFSFPIGPSFVYPTT